jgi:predicted GNAT family N-acyltransferase
MTNLIEADYVRYQQQILSIRAQVFIIEQGVPAELEVDEQDPLSRHLLLFEEDTPIATGRLTPDGHIGRLAVLKPYRQKGYGTQIIKQLEQTAAENGLSQVALGAQIQAINFYEKLGYLICSEIFIDAGIKHRMMKKTLDSQQ